MKNNYLILAVLLIGNLAIAQNGMIRQVRMGKIGISIYYQDELITIGSNSVRLEIDDVTSEMTIRLDPATLKTGIDSLDRALRSRIYQDVIFRGVIGEQRLWEKGDRPSSFEVEGELTIEGVTSSVSLFGSMRKGQQGMGVDGILYLHFDPELKDYELDERLPGFAEFGCVEILQPLEIESDRH